MDKKNRYNREIESILNKDFVRKFVIKKIKLNLNWILVSGIICITIIFLIFIILPFIDRKENVETSFESPLEDDGLLEDLNYENIIQEYKEDIIVIEDTSSPENTIKTIKDLGIVDPTIPYNSKRLTDDVTALVNMYPEILTLNTIGKSALGKDIPLITLGFGERSILWVGAIHAREVLTSAYLLLVIEEYANAYSNEHAYDGISAERIKVLLNEFTVYFVPMANPDGVDIVTFNGNSNVNVDDIRTWRNNANGVDLNRNFPFDWERASSNSSSHNHFFFRGFTAGDEPEVKALIELCESKDFEHMVSYHTAGQVIFWRDEKNGVIPGDEFLASIIEETTEYKMQPPTKVALNGWAGCFENWFRYKYNKPGICLEFATFNTADKDLISTFYSADAVNWSKTRILLFAVLDNLSFVA